MEPVSRFRLLRDPWLALTILACTALCLALPLLVGCAKTMLVLRAEKGGAAVLTLRGGSKVTLQGPGDLVFLCRTWGDSYFQIANPMNVTTCSGGQISSNGVKLGGVVTEAIVKGVISGTGVGAAGGAASGGGDALKSALEKLKKAEGAAAP